MADVLVIGAGLIGSSIAWKLAQAGFRVTLQDAGRFGGEASSAGAGMLTPGGEMTERSLWLDLALRSMALYPSFVRQLTEESGVPVDFAICGSHELPEADQRALVSRARTQIALGIRSKITPEGAYYPDDGYVDPGTMLAALRVACDRRGVVIRENDPVRELDGDLWDAVVLAAGAWSGSIAISVHGQKLALPETIPVKGHLIGYRLPPGRLGAIRRCGHTYLLQRANGFTVAGSNEEHAGFDRSVDLSVCEDLHRRAVRLWPELESHQPDECWIGFRPGTPAGIPHLRQVPGANLWLAYGHYRNGILLTPVSAEEISGQITSSLGRG